MNYTKINYEERNIEDYKRLSDLLFLYHSGSAMQQNFINMIAQATPEQRIQSMNFRILKDMGIHLEYGIGNSDMKYEEQVGEALTVFYYGDRKNLTQDQLMLILTLTDDEKLSHLESYSRSHFARVESSIMTSSLENAEKRFFTKLENYDKINYDEKNIEDYKRLSDLLFLYHSGSAMQQNFINMIAQATPQQRIQSMNFRVLKDMGIHLEYGVGNSDIKYEEQIGEALTVFYYGDRKSLTLDQLILISTISDEEKLIYLESYSRSHFARVESSIMTSSLEKEEISISRKK